MSSASNEELGRFSCVHHEEKHQQLVCGGTPDPEQSGSLKVESSQDTRTFVEPALDYLDGEQPLHSFTGDCEGQDVQFNGIDMVEGACRPQHPSAGTSEEGLGQGRRSEDVTNPTHHDGLGTEPGPSARTQVDMASHMSEGFEDGNPGDGAALEESRPSLASKRLQRHSGKRKVPLPAAAPNECPEEEQLQRRLMKNRRTAAASRERKQKEMESLAVKVQALEVDNAGLKQALRHRNAEILALRLQLPRSEQLAPVAEALQLPQPAAPAATSWPPLRPGFPAWPPPWGHRRPDVHLGQEHVQVVRSAQQPPSSFGVLVGTEPRHAPGGADPLSGGFRPPHDARLLLRAPSLGQPLTVQTRKGIGSSSLPSSLSSTEAGAAWQQQYRSLSASGLAADARSGFIRGLDGQFLRLASGASMSSQEPPTPVFPVPCPAGQLDGQLLRARSSSCPDAPPTGGPAVEQAGGPAGGSCPAGQLLRARSGSYPPQPQHMLAQLDRRFLASALDTSFLLPLPDPGTLDQMDFDNLWAQLN